MTYDPIHTVAIPLASGKTAYVAAGPTRARPMRYKLIRCAAEIPVSEDHVAFDIATKDFDVFSNQVLDDNIPDILAALGAGERLYVGCMGGTGRTGTLLALLVAQHPQFTGRAAVDYIRRVYRAHACETKDQENQVLDLAGLYEASAPMIEFTSERAEAALAMEPPAFSPELPAIQTRQPSLWRFLTGRG